MSFLQPPFSPAELIPALLVVILALAGCQRHSDDDILVPLTTTSVTVAVGSLPPPLRTGPDYITVPTSTSTIPGADVPFPSVPHDECCAGGG